MEKILKRKQIVIDEEIYPRHLWSWQTSYDYSQSMKTGAKFPDIVVALYDGAYVLVDGRHRLGAYKNLKQDDVQVDVLKGLDKKEIFLEAIKRNITNARPLSVHDKSLVVYKLKKMKFTMKEISSLMNIPLGKMSAFTVNRVTNTFTGETVILKNPLKHLAGKPVSDNVEFHQVHYQGNSQFEILDEMISLVENKLLDMKNIKVKEKVKRLRTALNKFLKS